MIAKLIEKEKAMGLRRQGLSYKEILKQIPVSKSSLSLWLRDAPLTPDEAYYLSEHISKNITNGRIKAAVALRENARIREEALFVDAKEEFERFKTDSLFFVGVALYWAEGSKRSTQFQFVNSDTAMVQLMLVWMEKYFGVVRTSIDVRLYIHKPYMHENCEGFWSNAIGIPLKNFKKTIYKPTNLSVKKRPNYMGCLRVSLPCSIGHMRKMCMWQRMVVEYYEKQ